MPQILSEVLSEALEVEQDMNGAGITIASKSYFPRNDFQFCILTASEIEKQTNCLRENELGNAFTTMT